MCSCGLGGILGNVLLGRRSTNKTGYSDIELRSIGYGTYCGKTRNGPFIKALGYKDSFSVAVKTPSPFADASKSSD